MRKTKRNPTTFSCLDMKAYLDSEPVEPCVQLVKLYSIHASNYILLAGREKSSRLIATVDLYLMPLFLIFVTFLHRLFVGLGVESNSPLPAQTYTQELRDSPSAKKNSWSQRKT